MSEKISFVHLALRMEGFEIIKLERLNFLSSANFKRIVFMVRDAEVVDKVTQLLLISFPIAIKGVYITPL